MGCSVARQCSGRTCLSVLGNVLVHSAIRPHRIMSEWQSVAERAEDGRRSAPLRRMLRIQRGAIGNCVDWREQFQVHSFR